MAQSELVPEFIILVPEFIINDGCKKGINSNLGPIIFKVSAESSERGLSRKQFVLSTETHPPGRRTDIVHYSEWKNL